MATIESVHLLVAMSSKALEEENGRPYVSEQVQNNNAQRVSCAMLHFSLVEADHLNFFFSNPNRMACTIRNTGTRLYLAGSGSNLVEGGSLISQSTAFEWSIQTFGP